MSQPINSTNQQGFTILELMIATMVFSVIFLATSTALVQIGKLYYKGLVTSRTQETTRSLADQVSQQLQFGGLQPEHNTATFSVTDGTNRLVFSSICLGNTRYSYRLNTQTNGSTPAGTYDKDKSQLIHGLWKDTYTGDDCPPLDLSQVKPSASGEDVLAQGARLTQFSVDADSANPSLYIIKIGVLYGDNDLLAPDPTTITTPNDIATLHCGSIIGDQWCAGSQFTTTVLQRLGN